MRASSTMKNSTPVVVMWKKDFLPTEHTSVELCPECHSLCMAAGRMDQCYNHTHTLGCLNPVLSISMDEEF